MLWARALPDSYSGQSFEAERPRLLGIPRRTRGAAAGVPPQPAEAVRILAVLSLADVHPWRRPPLFAIVFAAKRPTLRGVAVPWALVQAGIALAVLGALLGVFDAGRGWVLGDVVREAVVLARVVDLNPGRAIPAEEVALRQRELAPSSDSVNLIGELPNVPLAEPSVER